MNIRDLRTGDKKVNVEGAIVGIEETKRVSLKSGGSSDVAIAELSDSSGSISLQLWNGEIAKVKVGDRVKIENGYVSDYKGKNRLSVGQYGKISVTGGTPTTPFKHVESVSRAEFDALVARVAEIEKAMPKPQLTA